MKNDRFVNIVTFVAENDMTEYEAKEIQYLIDLVKAMRTLSKYNEADNNDIIIMRNKGYDWDEIGEALKISAGEARKIYKAYMEGIGSIGMSVLADRVPQQDSIHRKNTFSDVDPELVALKLDKRKKLVYNTHKKEPDHLMKLPLHTNN